MPGERRSPAVRHSSNNTGGRGGMIKTPINLQDLRRKIYTKAKADTAWRFWGLYVHVCKMETLREAYLLAKKNNGAPGLDGVTFEGNRPRPGVRLFGNRSGHTPAFPQHEGHVAGDHRRADCPPNA